MLTKKKLFELLKDVPDNALIGKMQTLSGTVCTCAWPGQNVDECNFIMDIMKDAKQIPLKNTFSLDDFK